MRDWRRRLTGGRRLHPLAIAAATLLLAAGAAAGEVAVHLLPSETAVAGSDLIIRAEVSGMDRVEQAEARIVTASGGLLNIPLNPSPDHPGGYVGLWRKCVDVGEHSVSVYIRGVAGGETATVQARGRVSVVRGARIEARNLDLLDFGEVYSGETVEAALDLRLAPGVLGEVEILTLPLDGAKSRIEAGCFSLDIRRFPAESPPQSPVALRLVLPEDQAPGNYEGFVHISSITDELILPARATVRRADVRVEPEALSLEAIEIGGASPRATLRVSVEPRGVRTIAVSQPVIGDSEHRIVIRRQVVAGEPAEFTFTVPVSRHLEPGSYRTFVDVAWPGGRVTVPVRFEIVSPPMPPHVMWRLGLAVLLAALLLALLLMWLFSKRRKPHPLTAFLIASAIVHIIILLLLNMLPVSGAEAGMPDRSSIGVVLLPGEPGFMPATGEGGGLIEIAEAGPRSEFERAMADVNAPDTRPSEDAADAPEAGAIDLAHARADDGPVARRDETALPPERLDPSDEVEAAAQLAQKVAEQETETQRAGSVEVARRDVAGTVVEPARATAAESVPAPAAGTAPARAELTDRPRIMSEARSAPDIPALPGHVVESPTASVDERYEPAAVASAAPRSDIDAARPAVGTTTAPDPTRPISAAAQGAPISLPAASSVAALRTGEEQPSRLPVADSLPAQWRPDQPRAVEVRSPGAMDRGPRPAAPVETAARGPREIDTPRPLATPLDTAARPMTIAHTTHSPATRAAETPLSPIPGPTGDLPDIHTDRGFTMPGMRGSAREGRITITTAIHSGDWDCDRTAMPNLAFQIRRRTDGALNADFNELKLTDPRIFDSAFMFFTGHKDFRLSDAEMEAMRRYTRAGGGIWINDSTHEGDETFDAALRREIARAFPDLEWRKIEMDHALFRACYDLSGGYMGYRIPPGDKYRVDYLEGLFIDGRLAVLYTRNDYGDGLGIDANTFPLMASLTDLSPQEMMEGSVRMGINTAFYFLFARAGGDEEELGGRLRSAVGRHLEDRETRSRAIVTARGRSLEEMAPDTGWGHEAGWSDATDLSREGEAWSMRVRRGGEGKNVIAREISADISGARYLLLDVENRMNAGARVAVAFSVGEDWRYYESPPRYSRPGRNTLVFDLRADDFKSEASGWNHNAALTGLNDLRRIYALVYPIRDGEIRMLGCRFVDDLDE